MIRKSASIVFTIFIEDWRGEGEGGGGGGGGGGVEFLRWPQSVITFSTAALDTSELHLGKMCYDILKAYIFNDNI